MNTAPELLTTPELARIAKWATDNHRNRQVTEGFIQNLDPEGIHVVPFRMLHNDQEWRCQILAKMAGTLEPATVWLDAPMGTNFLSYQEPDVG